MLGSRVYILPLFPTEPESVHMQRNILNFIISKKKSPCFELAVLQCDGLLMNESAENGARDKKERTEAGRMRLAWHVSLLQV